MSGDLKKNRHIKRKHNNMGLATYTTAPKVETITETTSTEAPKTETVPVQTEPTLE